MERLKSYYVSFVRSAHSTLLLVVHVQCLTLIVILKFRTKVAKDEHWNGMAPIERVDQSMTQVQ